MDLDPGPFDVWDPERKRYISDYPREIPWKHIAIGVLVGAGLLLALLGCASDTPTPRPSLAPPPAPFPFYDGFLGLSCTEATPPVCVDDGRPWATFDRPGKQGQDCLTPDICYTIVGRTMLVDADDPGFPMMRRQTVSKDAGFRIDMTVRATCKPGGICYIGPVSYDGENVPPKPEHGAGYRAIYLDNAGIRRYGPTTLEYLALTIPGRTYELGLEYNAGAWIYYIDNQLVRIEINGDHADPTELFHDPMPSIWAGAVNAVVTGWRAR